MQQFPDLVRQTVGHYRILKALAEGGMAIVYEAEDLHLRRKVAIKVFRPEPGETGSFLRRFTREAQVLASLDHPNILLVHDYGEQDGFAYLVMPLMTQGSLKQRLTGQPLPATDVLRLAEQILSALQYAHDHGLVHRDIKPSNLLFKADGTLLLSDFGLVKILPTASWESEHEANIPTVLTRATADDQSTLAYAGTPQYMAPEQINGQAIPQSDIYSVGIILYELLTGVCPFVAEHVIPLMMLQLTEPPRPPSELNPLLPPQLEAVVLRALEKDPTRRYQSASAFLQALYASQALTSETTSDALYAPEQSHQSPQTPALQATTDRFKALPITEPQRPRKRPAGVLLSVLLVLVLLSSTLGFLIYQNNQSPTTPTASLGSHTTLTGTPTTFSGHTPTPASNASVPIPQTACPHAGQANRAALAELPSQGTHQNLVYLTTTTTFNPTYSIISTFKRYDITTGQSTEILKLPANTTLSSAQVSGDGQWLSFLAVESDAKNQSLSKLEMVRIDGHYLQTLYCTSKIMRDALWSPDQGRVIFTVLSPTGIIQQDTPATMYDLFVTTGELWTVLRATAGTSYTPLTWFHQSNLLYMTNFNYVGGGGGPLISLPHNLYLFDTFPGEQQPPQPSTPILVSKTNGCQDYTLSPDNTRLFISRCLPVFQTELEGPSQIQVQNVSDPRHPSPASTIFSSDTLAVLNIAAVSNTTLLVNIDNSGGDSSQNGIWRLNKDGTGLQKLTSHGWLASDIPVSGGAHQDVWTNISRDGQYYCVQGSSASNLVYAPLSGAGTPTLIDPKATPIGWTTL